MPVGFQTFVDGGSIVQIDSDRFTYMLKQLGRFTGTFFSGSFGGAGYVGTVILTGCTKPIVFVPPGQLITGVDDLGSGSFRYSFYTQITEKIEYAYFDIGNFASSPNIGLKLYNSSGQLTFDSNYPALLIVAAGIADPAGTLTTNVPVSRPAGTTYWYNGAGGYWNVSGGEIFPGEYADELYYQLMDASPTEMDFGLAQVSVGGTSDPSRNEYGPPAPWMVADMSHIVSNLYVPVLTSTNTSSSTLAITSGVTFKSTNGKIESIKGSDIATIGTWINPATDSGLYAIKARVVSGTSPTGPAFNLFHPATSDISWVLTRPSGGGAGTTSCVLNIQIRRADDNYVLADGNITLQATRTAPL